MSRFGDLFRGEPAPAPKVEEKPTPAPAKEEVVEKIAPTPKTFGKKKGF